MVQTTKGVLEINGRAYDISSGAQTPLSIAQNAVLTNTRADPTALAAEITKLLGLESPFSLIPADTVFVGEASLAGYTKQFSKAASNPLSLVMDLPESSVARLPAGKGSTTIETNLYTGRKARYYTQDSRHAGFGFTMDVSDLKLKLSLDSEKDYYRSDGGDLIGSNWTSARIQYALSDTTTIGLRVIDYREPGYNRQRGLLTINQKITDGLNIAAWLGQGQFNGGTRGTAVDRGIQFDLNPQTLTKNHSAWLPTKVKLGLSERLGRPSSPKFKAAWSPDTNRKTTVYVAFEEEYYGADRMSGSRLITVGASTDFAGMTGEVNLTNRQTPNGEEIMIPGFSLSYKF